MKRPDFETALNECLERLRHGHSIEHCLMDYPEYAPQLRPLLQLATEIHRQPKPRPDTITIQAHRQRMFDALAIEQKAATLAAPAVSFASPIRSIGRVAISLRQLREVFTMKQQFVWRSLAAFLVLFFLSSWFSVTASAESLPGNTLYPVKRTWEAVRLSLATSDYSRQQLEGEFARERLEEIQTLMAERRPGRVRFTGIVEAMMPEQWIVEGLTLRLRETTVISGIPALGLTVQVQAQVETDGTLVALHIEAVQMAWPAASPTPQATHTAMPSHTPQHTPVPTHEPSHTPMPTPQATRTPQHTPVPTHEPSHTPDHTPAPTHEPSHTPMPTHEPSHTPHHTAEPTHHP